MKTKIISKTGKKEVELPKCFSGKIREDILQKVFEAEKGMQRQAYGSKYMAGAGYSASGILKHARHKWKTTYGKGISRVPRKIFSRHGASFNWEAATIASARGGRRAHPPKPEKNWFRKINKKEKKIAFCSAFAGTVNPDALERKYKDKVKSGFVISSDFLKLKTKEIKKMLDDAFENPKIWKTSSIRAGKGKLRGRRYKTNAGLLLVTGNDEKLKCNGIDIVNVSRLKINDLAPNGEPGRIAGYTEKAIEEIEKKFGGKK